MKQNNTHERTYGEVVAINVDLQNDFCPGGSLAVKHGDEVIAPINRLNTWVRDHYGFVIDTGDEHPKVTSHFQEFGGPWLEHCVADTYGAALHRDLVVEPTDALAKKGMSGNDDGYSGYDALLKPRDTAPNHLVNDLPEHEQTVGNFLERVVRVNRHLGKRTVVLLTGLAGDYCVPATGRPVLERISRDWADLVWVSDAIRSVNKADGERAKQALIEAGALAMTTEEIISGGITIDHHRLEV
jgi:nicotinamidase/pyrazinamidase